MRQKLFALYIKSKEKVVEKSFSSLVPCIGNFYGTASGCFQICCCTKLSLCSLWNTPMSHHNFAKSPLGSTLPKSAVNVVNNFMDRETLLKLKGLLIEMHRIYYKNVTNNSTHYNDYNIASESLFSIWFNFVIVNNLLSQHQTY